MLGFTLHDFIICAYICTGFIIINRLCSFWNLIWQQTLNYDVQHYVDWLLMNFSKMCKRLIDFPKIWKHDTSLKIKENLENLSVHSSLLCSYFCYHYELFLKKVGCNVQAAGMERWGFASLSTPLLKASWFSFEVSWSCLFLLFLSMSRKT
jgi:hypothetical protein